MKGIILAGGKGTRLQPLTFAVNKHLLPIGDKPMMLYPLERLLEIGIKDICIVSSKDGVVQTRRFFEKYKVDANIEFIIQENADGVAGALRLCESFVGDDNCTVILGDNIFIENINVNNIKDCRIFARYVEDGSQLGVIKFDNNNKMQEIVEKPQDGMPGYAAVGIYVFTPRVFKEIKSLKKSKRGEYEITDINNLFIKEGRADCSFLKDKWLDAGTIEDYKEANKWMWNL